MQGCAPAPAKTQDRRMHQYRQRRRPA